MSRLLLILFILALGCFDGDGQAKDLNFDRMRISYNGDSLIKQEYELVIKSKKIYFITPFASYLHIKGEKYRTVIRFDKIKRKKYSNLLTV